MRAFVEAVGRGAVAALLPLRDALRRRRHRPARHPHRARHLPVRDRQPGRSRAPTASASSGCDATMITTTARRQPRRDRVAGVPHLPPARHRDRRGPLRRRRGAAVRRARPTSPSACPATRPAETYLDVDAILARRASGPGRRDPPRLRLPVGERRLRARGRRRRADLGRTGARSRSRRWARRSRRRAHARRPASRCWRPPAEPTEADLPLLVKASAGGGGRGMRIVRDLAELDAEIERAGGGGVGVRRRHRLRRAVRRARPPRRGAGRRSTGTATSSCSASATARSSAATRRSSRRRPPLTSRRRSRPRCTRPRARRPRRSATSAPARSSSSTTPGRSGSSSSR